MEPTATAVAAAAAAVPEGAARAMAAAGEGPGCVLHLSIVDIETVVQKQSSLFPGKGCWKEHVLLGVGRNLT